MPHRVVDRLEPVEVHQQQRAGLRLPEMILERALEQIGDVQAVREAGQRVVPRELIDLLFGLALFGEVGAAAAKALKIAERVRNRMA